LKKNITFYTTFSTMRMSCEVLDTTDERKTNWNLLLCFESSN